MYDAASNQGIELVDKTRGELSRMLKFSWSHYQSRLDIIAMRSHRRRGTENHRQLLSFP